MTTQTNAQVVAELYWTLRAIKEATGVTTKCWRPPFGDVDDRVRAIAHQMGLQTMIWDQDTNDWDMPGEGGGKLAPSKVDGYFQKWIDTRKKGTDKTGHIVLQHELNNATVKMAEKWLPKLQTSFNVVTIQECLNVAQPYWETNWIYPTEKSNSTISTNTTAISNTTVVSNTTATTTPLPTGPSVTDINLTSVTTPAYTPTSAPTSAPASTLSNIPAVASDVTLSSKDSLQSSASIVTVSGASFFAIAASFVAYLY